MSSDAPQTALKRKADDAAGATLIAGASAAVVAGASATPAAKKPKARCGDCGGGHKTGFVNCKRSAWSAAAAGTGASAGAATAAAAAGASAAAAAGGAPLLSSLVSVVSYSHDEHSETESQVIGRGDIVEKITEEQTFAVVLAIGPNRARLAFDAFTTQVGNEYYMDDCEARAPRARRLPASA